MNDFPCAQKLKGSAYIGIGDDAQQVVVGSSCLLLWGDLVSTTYTKI